MTNSPRLVNLAARRLNAAQVKALINARPGNRSRPLLASHPYTVAAKLTALRAKFRGLRRPIRRRKAIIKHLRGPPNNSGVRPRLAPYNVQREALIESRAEAQRRAAQTPAARVAMKRHRLFQAAIRAYLAYQQTGQNGKNAAWNRFLRTYAKSEAFRKNNNKRPISTPNNARRLMREWGYY